MSRAARVVICLSLIAAGFGALSSIHAAGGDTSGTPAPLVDTYKSLSDAILAVKSSEANLVRSILGSTYGHAEAALAEARANMKAKKPAKAEIEKLASLVSQLGNEGDGSVAGVRKRLLEGGHHHNAQGEQKGIYDEGFVIVTRAAKKVFLDAAGAIGKLAAAPDAAALDAEWQKVSTQFSELMAKGHS
ncbi:MAG TPA: hypothetical protein VFW45_13745 [Candidatus Polarisedimenticolia bacterium]|nr:hypothetical protein [Candidatus Polarisedimenticolia bacterium]